MADIEIMPVDLDGIAPMRTLPKILCCLCGVEIDANPANMCVNCLRGQVDITEGIPKQIIMHQCRGCLRYLRPPWAACEPESRELLAICLKKITGLNKVRRRATTRGGGGGSDRRGTDAYATTVDALRGAVRRVCEHRLLKPNPIHRR